MITEVRIRNFKRFAEIDLSLAPLTLLTGVNNTGKSTVLQALLLLRQSHFAGELGRGGLALNGDIVRLGTAAMAVREGEADLQFGLSWDDGATVGFAFIVETVRGRAEIRSRDSPPVADYESRPPFAVCRYLSADRTGPRTSFPLASVHTLKAGDIGPRGEFAPHFLAEADERGEMLRIDSLHHANAGTRKLRPEVEAWLGMLSPDVAIRAELQVALDVCGLGFTFPGPTGRTDPQRSTHVGFGLTYLLPILVAILSAQPGDLIMVENPEAHLHPRAQGEVGRLLARAAAAGAQVIVETHSDHVLNATRIAVKRGIIPAAGVQVHFFLPGTPDVVSPEIHEDGSISEWPAGFFDEWDNAIDELLPR